MMPIGFVALGSHRYHSSADVKLEPNASRFVLPEITM